MRIHTHTQKVAQQEAERAKYTVKQAMQDKQSTIVKAEGEAKSAELIGTAVAQNPGGARGFRWDLVRKFSTKKE